MARMTVKPSENYQFMLSRLSQNTEPMLRAAVFEGTAAVTDEIRARIKSLPEDRYRLLRPGEQFRGVTPRQKQALLDGLGIASIERDARGNVNTKVGFAGYMENSATKKYPRGLPIPMLARAVESGSSVRVKTPYVRTAVRAAKKAAVDAMEKSVDKSIQKMMK